MDLYIYETQETYTVVVDIKQNYPYCNLLNPYVLIGDKTLYAVKGEFRNFFCR